MTTAVTKFLFDNSNTILRTLGVTTMFGSAANFVRTEKNSPAETSDVKVKRLALHNAIAALGAAITLGTLTTNKTIGNKTRLFCLASTAAMMMYPTVMVQTTGLLRNVKAAAISVSTKVAQAQI